MFGGAWLSDCTTLDSRDCRLAWKSSHLGPARWMIADEKHLELVALDGHRNDGPGLIQLLQVTQRFWALLDPVP